MSTPSSAKWDSTGKVKTMKSKQSIAIPSDLSKAVKDIKLAILQARAKAAHLANAEALKLYFFVGGYISKKTRNAKWGSGAITALSNQLQVELPGLRGFSASNIKRMRQLYEVWSEVFEFRPLPMGEIDGNELVSIRPLPMGEITADQIRAFLSVGFTNHALIVEKTKTADERWFYVLACVNSLWTVEQLQQHLRADDYHHIGALPNNFAKTLSPMTLATKAVRSFRDEYLLELVNLDNVDARADQDVDERVLSKSLVSDIEKTIQTLGGDDFCFMGREKRLMIEGEEVFIDLLFYHRSLRAMVAVELKMGKFRPSYLGQLELYLSALDATVRHADENPSIGLLLCEKMNKGFVEFAVRDKSKPLGIATYQTLQSIPKPYKTLAPVIEGVKRVLTENSKAKETSKNFKQKGSKK